MAFQQQQQQPPPPQRAAVGYLGSPTAAIPNGSAGFDQGQVLTPKQRERMERQRLAAPAGTGGPGGEFGDGNFAGAPPHAVPPHLHQQQQQQHPHHHHHPGNGSGGPHTEGMMMPPPPPPGSTGQQQHHHPPQGGMVPMDPMAAHLQAQCRELQRQLHLSIDAERKAQAQIHQLQLMSKSQTAILRTNLNNKIDEREKLLEKALEALAATDPSSASADSSSSSSSGGAGAVQNSSTGGGGSLAVINEDGISDSGGGATSVVGEIREQLQRLREAKGAPAGFSEAFKQVQLEVEELRRQNGELHRTLDHAHAQLKHQAAALNHQHQLMAAQANNSASANAGNHNGSDASSSGSSSSGDNGNTASNKPVSPGGKHSSSGSSDSGATAAGGSSATNSTASSADGNSSATAAVVSHAEMARKVSDLENDRKKLIGLLHEAKERLKEGPHRTPSPAVGALGSAGGVTAAAAALGLSGGDTAVGGSSSGGDSSSRGGSSESAEVAALRSELASLRASSSSSSSHRTDGSSSSSTSGSGREISAEGFAALEAELAEAKASAKRNKAEKKALKKDAEERLQRLQAEARESEAQMVAAMEAEVQKVLAEKEAEFDGARASDAKALKKMKKQSAGIGKYLTAAQTSTSTLARAYRSHRSATAEDLQAWQAYASDAISQIVQRCSEESANTSKLELSYKREYDERRKLFNLVQELRGNIRVFCRARPPSARELERGADSDGAVCVDFPDSGVIKVENDRNKEKTWEFDQTFDFHSSQEQVYSEVSPLVTSVLDGYNVCIFAYGQTGSGKTYTMTGPAGLSAAAKGADSDGTSGVNTRALSELFKRSTKRSNEITDQISVSVLEIYCEQIRDLLSDNVGSERLEIRQGDYGNYVPNLTTVPVTHMAQVLELLTVADSNRSTASTNMNEHSSRSHLMVSVYVESKNHVSGAISRGKLHLVDLAGSERISKSGAAGKALKEAQAINKSLSALGDVIMSRAQKSGHVPFRNSTLTHLLQDSLSGDAKTLMFVCISPVLYNSEETFCSLNFASRVRTVELGKATKHVEGGGVGGGGGGASAKKGQLKSGR